MSTRGNVVPAWRAGCLGPDDYNKYICLDCGIIITPPIKGFWVANDPTFTCPICSSLDKEPTKKVTKEKMEEKKIELRERMK